MSKRKYKYPYIPPEYYPAVMFAAKIVRETHQLNRAVKTAARYYSVDRDEVLRHLRARQAAGQKGSATGRTYKWFVVASCWCNELYSPCFTYDNSTLRVVRATTVENVLERYAKVTYTDGYNDPYTEVVATGPIGSKAEAENLMARLESERDERDTPYETGYVPDCFEYGAYANSCGYRIREEGE